MRHRTGHSRQQFGLFATPLDDMIAPDNLVRVVDAFVNALDLAALGFTQVRSRERGAPPYHPGVLLKIYLYGYFNSIRSSRKLETECRRNIEMMWLIECQKPSYHTISNFRSMALHRRALKNVFAQLVQFCKQAEVIGGEVVAVDGSKFRAQNSMKNNFNLDKVERQIEYHEKRFDEYMAELEAADQSEHDGHADILLEKAQAALAGIARNETLREQLQSSGQNQISLTDADARALPLGKGVVEVAYNIQLAVDEQHSLIIHHEVTNEKDSAQLAPVALETRAILQSAGFTVLADKGYCQGQSLDTCQQNGIETCVAPLVYAPAADTGKFRKEDFEYDEKQDVYRCPYGEELKPYESTYTRRSPKTGEVQYAFKRYSLPNRICQGCPLKAHCLTANELEYRHKRHIDRNEYDAAIERNAAFVSENKDLYRRRQAIVEHPFGTIKRSWGYTYTLLRGKEKVGSEFALITTVYNLRRLVSILGVSGLISRFQSGFFAIFVPWRTAAQEVEHPRCNTLSVVWCATDAHSIEQSRRA